MHISAPYIANLFEYGSFHGIHEHILKKHINNQQLDVCQEDNFIEDIEFLNAFEELITKTNDPYIGLHFGQFLNLKALGMIFRLSLNASSVQQAVLLLKEYFEHTFPLVKLSIHESSENYTLEISTHLQGNIAKQLLDSTFCFMYRELQLMTHHKFSPTCLLPHDYLKAYLPFFEKLQQGKSYQFIFTHPIKNIEINTKRLTEIEILLPQFMQMLAKKKYPPFALQIRNMILNMCCPELPNFEKVCAQFALSSRSIQRKLTNEKTSFRKITEEIKQELSIYLSTGKKMKKQDIALILGYSELSAYLHAVKRWECSNIKR